MSAIFSFGERLDGYAVPVLNERAVRAAAGIVFFFAIVSFMNAWLVGNSQFTWMFAVAFLIDFTIRTRGGRQLGTCRRGAGLYRCGRRLDPPCGSQ